MMDKEFRGWWISPQGEPILIPDHFRYLFENPEKFGFPKEELARVAWEMKGDSREKYMGIAFQRGWIRVREQNGFTIFQYWEKTDSVVSRIKNLMQTFSLSASDQLAVTENCKMEKYKTTVERFFEPDIKS
jgi:hypothetical protein